MKRKVYQLIGNFISDSEKRSFILSGAPYTGKTFACLDVLKSNHIDFLYLNVDDDRAFNDFLKTECRRHIDCETEIHIQTMNAVGVEDKFLEEVNKPATKSAESDAFFNEAVDKPATNPTSGEGNFHDAGVRSSLYAVLTGYFRLPLDTISRIPVVLDDFSDNDVFCDLLTEYLRTPENSHDLKLLIIWPKVPKDILSAISKHSSTIYYEMNPISFDEFLVATDHEWYRDIIEGHFQSRKKVPQIIHDEICNLFDIYINIGGLPAAVNEYYNSDMPENASHVNRELFRNIITRTDSTDARNIIEAVPLCLETKSRRFSFTKIHRGATYSKYMPSVEKLSDSGIININYYADVSDDSLLIDESSFRLYFNCFSFDFSKSEDSRIYNYLSAAFRASNIPAYFTQTRGGAQIDYVLHKNGSIIPVMVKLNHLSKDKALNAFEDACKTDERYIFHDGNFDFTGKHAMLPYYAAFCIK